MKSITGWLWFKIKHNNNSNGCKATNNYVWSFSTTIFTIPIFHIFAIICVYFPNTLHQLLITYKYIPMYAWYISAP